MFWPRPCSSCGRVRPSPVGRPSQTASTTTSSCRTAQPFPTRTSMRSTRRCARSSVPTNRSNASSCRSARRRTSWRIIPTSRRSWISPSRATTPMGRSLAVRRSASIATRRNSSTCAAAPTCRRRGGSATRRRGPRGRTFRRARFGSPPPPHRRRARAPLLHASGGRSGR